ncbi:MAG: hypothetical protein LBS21_04070, partial [Clostridiales bacterium]|jgi:RHS repeat-associated protein|nr:hypothetical protein [Clostridiales bacterium]
MAFGSDGINYSYTYGNSLSKISAKVTNNLSGGITEKLYIQSDRLGSGRQATDAAGIVQAYTVLDEWGKPLEKVKANLGGVEIDVISNYTNHDFDEVLQIYYAKARFYDPNTQRFLAVDIIKGNVMEPESINPYIYVLNNPLSYYDSNGLDAIWLNGSKWTPFGHSSLLIQDENDEWFYFFFSIDAALLNEVTRIPKMGENTQEISANNEKSIINLMENLDNFNQFFGLANDPTNKNERYTSATYISGDFTESLEFAKRIVNKEEPIKCTRKIFNFLFNNENPYYTLLYTCSSASWEALMLGKLPDGTPVSEYVYQAALMWRDEGIVHMPNAITQRVERIFANKSFTKNEALREIEEKINKDRLWGIILKKLIPLD